MPKKFLVPQYIEMEDKIVGPLSMSQFLYCLTGGILCYIFYTLFDKILAYPLIVIFGGFFFAMAFGRFNERPLPKVLEALLLYFLKPKERIWLKKEAVLEKSEKPKQALPKTTPTSKLSPSAKKEKLKNFFKE